MPCHGSNSNVWDYVLMVLWNKGLNEVAKVFHNHPEVIIVDETTMALSQIGRELL